VRDGPRALRRGGLGYEARTRFTRRQRGAGGVIRGRRPKVPIARLPRFHPKDRPTGVAPICRLPPSRLRGHRDAARRRCRSRRSRSFRHASKLTGSAHHSEAVCRRSNRLRSLALG
jgi:hypothetical protein